MTPEFWPRTHAASTRTAPIGARTPTPTSRFDFFRIVSEFRERWPRRRFVCIRGLPRPSAYSASARGSLPPRRVVDVRFCRDSVKILFSNDLGMPRRAWHPEVVKKNPRARCGWEISMPAERSASQPRESAAKKRWFFRLVGRGARDAVACLASVPCTGPCPR
jgi:hypothetical protein